jgi:N-methylhydantoinase A/oxoprolinase/acetone carboxylase beta subunit
MSDRRRLVIRFHSDRYFEMKRIGIDVGGTNTDAVLINDGRVEHSVKAPTTANITDGMIRAIELLSKKSADIRNVDAVMVGTTHFINAVVQRKDLTRVGAIRIGAPATNALPPFCDWPKDLATLVRGGIWHLEGGHDYDGRRFMALDIAAARAAAKEIRATGISAVSVAAMFSPLDPCDEDTVAEILQEEVPGIRVTRSHQLGRIGLLERENAALLNASLADLADEVIGGFRHAIAQLGIAAPLFITQNDGTVAEAQRAAAFPVFSFASGATNSMRGAAYLSGINDAVVADVGGTTTDFGHLRQGFPREANSIVHVGGVRTFFRMPDLISIGIGGGTVIDPSSWAVGPQSVGYRLPEEGLVFGGKQITLTDIAVAAGLIELGDRARVGHLKSSVVDDVLARVKSQVEDNIDRIKTEAAGVTLIVVGGGGFLIPDKIDGAERIVRVKHGDCANAVGAAVAQVCGEVDQIFHGASRSEAMSEATKLAKRRAVAAGASSESLVVVDEEDIPIAYLPGNAMRVRVRIVGEIGVVKSA